MRRLISRSPGVHTVKNEYWKPFKYSVLFIGILILLSLHVFVKELCRQGCMSDSVAMSGD